jgi:hypothetical protein
MATDEILLRAAAWLSLAAWAGGEWWRVVPAKDPAWRRARAAWTTGALALLAHTALAFQVSHAWSHDHASAEIARRTEDVVGLAWDGGIWVNYAFDALWLGEVAWWWAAPAGFLARPRAVLWAVRLVFLTMFANGAIVFAQGPVVVLGVLAVVVAGLAWWRDAKARGATHA